MTQMLNDTDEQLIHSLQNGDTAALDELYRRYSRRLFVFCQQTLHEPNIHLVEDVVHDVFLRIIDSASTFNPAKALFRTWIFRIARNRCFDLGRRHQKAPMVPLVTTSEEEGRGTRVDQLADSTESIEERLAADSRHRAVTDCIQALEVESERQAVLLYFLGGKVYAEIGRILGRSTSTAKNRIDSALVKIRRCLEAKGIGNETNNSANEGGKEVNIVRHGAEE